MISVILKYSAESKAVALADGFKEETVLVKWEPILTHESSKSKRESEVLRKIKPYQYFLGDFWGAGVD